MIGQPISRVDGPDKVTGKAKYAAEFNVPASHMCVVVSSSITKGRIVAIDDSTALAVPGVLKVLRIGICPKIAWSDFNYKDQDAPAGSPFRPLEDEIVYYSGQPVALVIAETFEVARYAASLVNVVYHEQEHETNLQTNMSEARDPKWSVASLLKPPPPKPRGDAQQAYADAPAKMWVSCAPG